jgi:serine/threonine protein kinase
MNPADHWRRVRDLFEAAVDQPPDSLDSWLERESGGDHQLRADVRSLIDHHRRTGSFLVEPLGDRMADLMAETRVLQAGDRVGAYTIVREVGRGGMGRVYLATDARLGRNVALKALPPELTFDTAHRDRLRREARAAAALTHPGICTVYALEELDGDLFIAAEFVDGTTLRYQLDSGRRPSPTELTRVAGELAAALAHAHERGVVHRDLKPDNVMMTSDGRVKILDFGLARLATPDASVGPVTQPGTVFGTPAYMAPEQLQGQTADARSDVFAFGVLLYEYACGIHPFAAATPLGVAGRILESEPQSVTQRRLDVPPAVAAAIDQCLAKAPSGRLESGTAIVRALERGSEARPRKERVPGAPRRLAFWWRAHQFVAIGLYLIASILCWQIKEWLPGFTTAIFVAVAVAGTAAGVFRGHLVFTAQVNDPRLAVELRRAALVTLLADLAIGLALAGAGMLLASSRPVPAVLTIALGVGIALARLVVEPSTTAAFLEN